MAWAGRYSWYAEVNIGTEGSPNWYLIPPGVLKNFRCSINATSKSGSGTFRVVDKRGTLWETLDALSNNGVNQELRFYFGDKNTALKQVFGGYINTVRNPRNRVVLNVDHYMNLLTRELSDGDKYQDRTGTYMVADGTNGLIPQYFPAATAGVVPIGYTNHVDATGNQTGSEFEYNADGNNIMQAMKQIAAKTRKTGGVIPYDFIVDYCPTHAQKEIWFNVKNDASFASGDTLREGVDFFDSYKLDEDTSRIVNYWTVRGETGRPIPIDRDWWTEQNGTTDPTDRGWDYGYDCTNLVWSATEAAGSYAARGEFEDNGYGGLGYMRLDLTDSNAFNSTYTPYPMVSGSGYYYERDNLENLFIQFWMQNFDYSSGTFDGASGAGIQLYIRENDYSVWLPIPPSAPSLSREENPWFWNTTDYPDRDDVGAPSFSFQEDEYTFYEVPIIDGIFTEQASGYITGIQWLQYIDENTATWPGTERLNIDGLRIVDRSQYTESLVTDSTYPGSDATSISTYGRRKDKYNDRTIAPIYSGEVMTDGNTKAMCNRIANRLLGFTKNPTMTFTGQLKRFYDIPPLYTFTLDVPSRGVDSATYRMHEVSFTPAGQTIFAKPASFYDDTNYDIGAVVAQIKREIDESARRL